ncbi:MAG: hypothetical protein GX648_05155 [Crenarchaeota archaeon]|nr:hypothetical protein [Thermoproteota archaeon]
MSKKTSACVIFKDYNKSEYRVIYGNDEGKIKEFSNFRDLLSFMQEYFGEQ